MKELTSVKNAGLNLDLEERSILACILKNGKDSFIDVIDIIADDSFENPDNKIVFSSMKKLFESNETINESNILITGNHAYGSDDFILEKIKKCPPVEKTEIRKLASVLKNRQLIKQSVRAHKDAINSLQQLSATADTQKIFSVTESVLFDLVKNYSSHKEDIIKVSTVVEDVVNYWAENPTQWVGLPTPWPKFNESIGGGMRTGVTLIGSRSGVGKSSIAINVANFLSENDIPVLVLDTEMELNDVLPRIIANISDVQIRKIESGDFAMSDFDKNLVYSAVGKIKKSKLDYISIAGKGFDEILSIIRRWIYTSVGFNEKGKANQCLVIYDYFKIMDSSEISDMQEYQAMGFQISKLTDFCKMFDIPCLSFVQLNRDGVSKEGTDVIAQSDRLLWLTNSFSLFKEKTLDEMGSDGEDSGNRKMITLKSRYGGEHKYGQYISMSWKGATCTLKEVSLKDPYKKEQ